MSKEDIVYHGYPNNLDYKEIANLVLIHDKIYDANSTLTNLFSLSSDLAEMLDNLDNPDKNHLQEVFSDENLITSYSNIVILLSSISYYYGLNYNDWWDQEIYSVDKLSEVDEKNSQKFIETIIPSLRRAYKQNPDVIKDTIEVLYDVPLLNKFIIKSDEYGHDIAKIRKKYENVVFDSIELDLKDPNLYLHLGIDSEAHGYIDSFLINSQVVESSGLEMPLHISPQYANYIQYKYLKNTRGQIDQFKQRKFYEDAYDLFIPDIYTANINDLIELKNQKVFKEFRKEIGVMINQWFEDSSYKPNFSDYLNEQYITEIEGFAVNKAPNYKKILLKGFLGYLDTLLAQIPVIGLIPLVNTGIMGTELYEAYNDKKEYKFALSVIGIKDIIKK
ncbi:hypothetical protein [Methanobacterium sp.]|uniref:hypothetical protein n=1 Tax=Methanobacterium sp. TaxID=2164 RepID=UPI003158F847